MNYTDADGNKYELVYHPYQKGTRACAGCAGIIGNSSRCKRFPTCTPDVDGKRLHGYVWKQIIKNNP